MDPARLAQERFLHLSAAIKAKRVFGSDYGKVTYHRGQDTY